MEYAGIEPSQMGHQKRPLVDTGVTLGGLRLKLPAADQDKTKPSERSKAFAKSCETQDLMERMCGALERTDDIIYILHFLRHNLTIDKDHWADWTRNRQYADFRAMKKGLNMTHMDYLAGQDREHLYERATGYILALVGVEMLDADQGIHELKKWEPGAERNP